MKTNAFPIYFRFRGHVCVRGSVGQRSDGQQSNNFHGGEEELYRDEYRTSHHRWSPDDGRTKDHLFDRFKHLWFAGTTQLVAR
jgi:hypothetical protein